MDNEDLEQRQNTLVQFLSTRKEVQEYHIKTVMEMTRRLAKYEMDLNAANRKNRDMEGMLAEPGYGRVGDSRNRYDPLRSGEPNILQLPVGTRSIEIKL